MKYVQRSELAIPETPAWARRHMDERGINPHADADGNSLTEQYFDFVAMDDARRASGVVDDLDAHAVLHARQAMVDPPNARFEEYCVGAAMGDPREIGPTGGA